MRFYFLVSKAAKTVQFWSKFTHSKRKLNAGQFGTVARENKVELPAARIKMQTSRQPPRADARELPDFPTETIMLR